MWAGFTCSGSAIGYCTEFAMSPDYKELTRGMISSES